ncbi:hypothetical protein Q4Q35_20095 [Flavivirga aquimarina]|uniref:DUF1735 domain-containing protein n=1 Tax=Flavivirga aquimarina TaxID=2027862 RepID=A0ABT8WG63_9FLAO|nr:hypothetical protein [Flavivirga aquimarina]MDO5972108.1 hypothetical protein [Flavivirga aquimarina]
MLKELNKYLFLAIIIYLSLFSCVKEVDFDQADDFEISPVIESSLIFLDEPADSFIVNGVATPPISDYVEIDIFNNEFVVDNLIKADFVLEATNSINRGFEIQVDFINDIDQLVHTFTFSAPPSTDGSDVLSNHTEVFEGESLIALKNTSKLVFTLSILSGGAIDQSMPGRIALRSKAIFYLNIGEEI